MLASVALAGALFVFLPASPALALAVCPQGLSGLVVNGETRCFNANGDYEGYLSVSGTFEAEAVAAAPVQVDVPSSVMAAGESSTGTVAEGAGLAEIDAAAGGGEVMMASGSIPGLGEIVGAGFSGYMIGSQVASLACTAGLSWLCTPTPNPAYQPNGDVVMSAPGWVGSNQQPWSLSDSAGDSVTNLQLVFDDTKLSNGFESFPASAALEEGTVSKLNTNYILPGMTLNWICGDGWTGAPNGYSTAGQTGGWRATGGYNFQAVPTGYAPCDQYSGSTLVSKHGGVVGVQLQQIKITGSSGTPGTLGSATGSPFAIWYPVGSASRPANSVADPTRQWQTTNTCTATSGGGTVTEVATSGTFTETDPSLPPFPEPSACPSGTTLTQTKVVELTPDGQASPKTVWQVQIPATITNWQQNYPGCQNGVCRLGLYKNVGGTWTNCFAAQPTDLCNGWFQDANKSTDYECTYGPANTSSDTVVSINECTVYAPSFDPVHQAQGTVLGDPATGGTGNGQPNNQPGSAGSPLPGSAGSSCFPSGWAAFNPVEWVLKPVECALSWAFVPDTSTLAGLESQLTSALNGVGLGAWGSAISSLFGSLGGSGSGCTGPTVTFPITNTAMQPFNACTDPMKTVASISYAFSSVVIVVFGALAGLRILGGSFGFNVGLGERLKSSDAS